VEIGFREFLKDKLIFIWLCFMMSGFCAFLLFMVEASLFFALFIPCMLFLSCLASMLPEYYAKYRYYSNLRAVLERLDKKYLLSEIVEKPDFFDGGILHYALKSAGKAMCDEISAYRVSSVEYREYVELWVHEIKTPIAAAKLVCENTGSRELLPELDRIESFVEQALYYARASNVENDYIVKRSSLASLVNGALRSNARYLTARKIRVEACGLDLDVFTDAKWLTFIIRQIIDNSVKYGCRSLRFQGVQRSNSVSLLIRDDGAGVPEKDIDRVFDKGFTGENGRRYGRSTGLGLYLCRQLCLKLGLSLSLSSAPGEGTSVEIIFPKSEMRLD
jgi:signal transduction histidine kinase